jgi:AraC-like DNA-binding protein
MFLHFDDRLSDSPFVERVWCSHSERAGTFLSVAASRFEMAVTRLQGRTFLTLRGPETTPTMADCPSEGDWLGIRFTLGTYMPRLAPGELRDRRDITLPDASSRSFWLDGSAWNYPTFDNAEAFVARLVRNGIIARDPAVDAILHGQERPQSVRSDQRHFLRATGLTYRAVRQIERARHAACLLRGGTSILDTVHEAGYFDQAHLTRSLRQLIGQTPVEIARGTRQLSFLYKTEPRPWTYDAVGGYRHERIRPDRVGRFERSDD